MLLQNLHTHTTYCDGSDTPGDLVDTAIAKGFNSLGFSGHSYMSFMTEVGMDKETDLMYREEIARLKERYKDRLDIYTGLEFELFSEHDTDGYDYVIGACHFIKACGEHVLVDTNPQRLKTVIDTCFGGDALRLCKEYYRTFGEICSTRSFDIIGHFDVITRDYDTVRLFDTDSREYRCAALEAAHAIASRNKIFEINTGAMARSGRLNPYPQDFIIKELIDLGCHFTVSSDCHNREYLDCGFSEAFELLKFLGAKDYAVFRDGDFVLTPIE